MRNDLEWHNGILAGGLCRVTDNVVCLNFGTCGIYVYSVFNDIQNNTITDNGTGLICTNYAPNLILRNTFSGNSMDIIVGPGNTAPAPIAPGNSITNAGPLINISY